MLESPQPLFYMGLRHMGNGKGMGEVENDGVILLNSTNEADKGEPLLYAQHQCFENLTVEMKEMEW